MKYNVVVFDLDNTLAESKQALTPEMATLLSSLIAKTKVAITSGGKFAQLEGQVVNQLPPETHLENFYLLPTSGAALFEYKNAWTPVYQELLTNEEVDIVKKALFEGAQKTGLIDFDAPSYGERIENRGSQVSLSVLGQEAPPDEKRKWDPERVKRPLLQEAIAPLLPDFDVKVGGLTTIDVTKHGINKAYGIRKLSAHLGIPPEEMLYIGDELRPGGNDEVVKETSIQTRAVLNPSQTANVIEELLGEL
ncbi:MAG: HAD-IIB family hydrolase [Minisyncoccia bacterium]